MGRDDDGDGALGAAWGAGDDDASNGDDASSDGDGRSEGRDASDGGGPLPRAEDVEADGPRERPEPQGGDPATVDRITEVLQAHKTGFTVALLVYALLVMPWLYREGFELVGLAGGAAFLGGVVLVTVANARDARENLTGDDERRGF